MDGLEGEGVGSGERGWFPDKRTWDVERGRERRVRVDRKASGERGDLRIEVNILLYVFRLMCFW